LFYINIDMWEAKLFLVKSGGKKLFEPHMKSEIIIGGVFRGKKEYYKKD
jgi:hypothetical protein